MRKHMRDLNIIFNIGVTAYEQNNFRKAIEWFDLVLKQQPENVDMLNNIACYLIKMKELNKALFCLQKAETILRDDETILSNMAIAHAKNKNWSKAIFYFDQVFIKKPKDTTMINNLASCLMESGRYQLALRCLNKAISQEEHNLFLLFNKAQCLIYLRDCKEAKSVLQTAMKISPNNSVGLYLLGQIHEELMEETEALSYYNQAWGLV
ncbi:MAG: tetratricopeptide repeat protein [Syntrophomonadaceae bacterium]|nr:tetratricopeptide repeat protein [Syntrophomonadaceae bacterium]